MKRVLLLLAILLIPSFVMALDWGEARSKDLDDVLIIETGKKGKFVVVPKRYIVPILDTTDRVLIIQYMDAQKHIKRLVYKKKKSAMRVLKQLYPKDTFCLSKKGLAKCDFETFLKDEEEADEL